MGPPQPTANGETPAQLRKRLRGMLHEFETEAPFTLQRLCEVLLEPSKQYTRLDKLVRCCRQALPVDVQLSRTAVTTCCVWLLTFCDLTARCTVFESVPSVCPVKSLPAARASAWQCAQQSRSIRGLHYNRHLLMRRCSPVQGLALEKLLMVTSTVQPSRSPPERPTLASLPPVNENPPTPVLPTANGPIRVCLL